MDDLSATTDSQSRSLLRHWRFPAAFVLGALLVVDLVWPDWRQPGRREVTLITAAFLGGMCWPFSSYPRVWLLSLFAVAGATLAIVLDWRGECPVQLNVVTCHLLTIPFAAGASIVCVLIRFCVPLTLIVWCRRKWWPVRTPGFCVKCGYCLRGLSSRRCPECGTEFDPPHRQISKASGNPMH